METPNKSRVLLDTSVLVAALLSSQGASFYLLTTKAEDLTFLTNEYIFAETMSVLQRKFRQKQDQLQHDFFLLLAIAHIEVLPPPSKTSILKLTSIIESEDAPILSSAIKHADVLLSFDEDFLRGEVRQFAQKHNVQIYSPGEFLAVINN